MAENLTVTGLLARGLISNADIAAAVEAYLSDPETTAYPLGDQFSLDLSAAVRTALILARPEKR